jgi:hypothetical protein
MIAPPRRTRSHRGVPYQRQLDALKRRVKKIDARGWKRWMARLERAYRREWPEAAAVVVRRGLHQVGLRARRRSI